MLEPNQDVVSFKRLWRQCIYHNSCYDCSNQVNGNDEKVFEVSDKLAYYLLPIAYQVHRYDEKGFEVPDQWQ